MNKYKLAILTSHPIQYQTPLFRKLAENPEIDLIVYFCWDFGVEEKKDPEFGEKFKWDIPLLEGYQYKFLKNFSPKPSSKFWGQINPEIIKELKKNKPDALLVFGWNSFTNWLAFLTAFIKKIPVFSRSENPLNQELLKPKWKIKIKKIILGSLFKNINAFLYIGEENRKFFQYYGASENKLVFCPYAADNERFIKEAEKLRPNKSEFKKEIGLNKDRTAILFTGKLIEKKRPFDLLKAYQRAVNNFGKAALVFVGDGVLRPQLEKYVKDDNLQNVFFIGFKNQTELPKYYALADIFVLPSGLGETWGLVVNEAMCSSLPIVVSDIVGCGPDLVKNNENGFIFSLGNIEQLAQFLEDLIINSKKRKSFGEKSFKIIKDYSYDKDIAGILIALKRI